MPRSGTAWEPPATSCPVEGAYGHTIAVQTTSDIHCKRLLRGRSAAIFAQELLVNRSLCTYEEDAWAMTPDICPQVLVRGASLAPPLQSLRSCYSRVRSMVCA